MGRKVQKRSLKKEREVRRVYAKNTHKASKQATVREKKNRDKTRTRKKQKTVKAAAVAPAFIVFGLGEMGALDK